MKVEIISIGTELLVSDILDTNAAYISRSLREVSVTLTSKVTIGDHPEMIADAFRVALRRADFVIDAELAWRTFTWPRFGAGGAVGLGGCCGSVGFWARDGARDLGD